MNSECRDGKHANCDETAWDDELDMRCSCRCVCHSERELADVLDEYRGMPNVLPLWLAVSKLLELHRPGDWWPIAGERHCIECNRADQEGLDPTWWPCPTVISIREELVKGRSR